jgi:hypothetical protein
MEPLQKIFSPKAQRAKEIQKSPFDPPLAKGERGGFEKTWRALRRRCLGQTWRLGGSHLFSDSAGQYLTENFK